MRDHLIGDARQIAVLKLAQPVHDPVGQMARNVRRKPGRDRAKGGDAVFLDVLKLSRGIVDPLEDGFVRGEKSQQPVGAEGGIGGGKLIANAGQKGGEIVAECLGLFPVNEGAGAFEARKAAVDQLGDGLGAGLPGQRRRDAALEGRVRDRLIEDGGGEFRGAKRLKRIGGEGRFAGHVERPGKRVKRLCPRPRRAARVGQSRLCEKNGTPKSGKRHIRRKQKYPIQEK